jgi:serine protease Do
MADKVWDKCPKCFSKITNRVECKTCGIIFEKYFKAEARKKALAEQEAVKASKSGKKTAYLIASLILVAAIASSATFYFLGRKNSSPIVKPAVVQQQHANTLPAQKTVPTAKPVVIENAEAGTSGKSFIRIARNATVEVKTPWGLGSGFFISENTIITNKHVVEFNREKFEEYKKKVERDQKILELQRQRIDEAKNKMYRMPDGPTRRQFAIIIQEKEEELRNLLPEQQAKIKQLHELEENMDSQDVEIVMSDGTQHSVSSVMTSNDHDLALLKVYSVSAPVLRGSRDGQTPEEGDTVYAIGSPLGLQDTVTRGVFSGYRKDVETNEKYLQTDAAINPGNSGGPLIDSHGHVLGVNTMILNNTEGIGFAISIETVYKEFSTSL